jgi:hypothetical protein
MGIEGNALIKSGSSEYQAQVTADVSERLPRFSLKLSDGTLVDLSNLRVAVDFDYKKSISPTKSESFGRANEIKDTGDISGVMLTNYESYDLTGKYTFCNHQIAYLTKLQISHELELNILVARFKQAKKKLYTQRHLLLISRVDAVKNNLADVKAWLNDVILEMEKEGMVSGGFAKKLIA